MKKFIWGGESAESAQWAREREGADHVLRALALRVQNPDQWSGYFGGVGV